MAKTLYIQIEGGTKISEYPVDFVDTDYQPDGNDPAKRRIAGIKDRAAVPDSIQLVSALVGWWLIDDELVNTERVLRVQAPGNPKILKLACKDIAIDKSYANGGGDLVQAVTDKPVAEFNTIFILGWWSDLRKKVLRVQAPGNPTVLRIPADHVESTTGAPLQQRVRAHNSDGTIIADFDIPQLLAWWVEDENAPEEAGLTGKHLFVEVNDDPAPYLTISVDDAKVGTETDPRERNVVGLDKDGKVIASFNIASIYRYWFDFPPEKPKDAA
jgi:hypothetical protein